MTSAISNNTLSQAQILQMLQQQQLANQNSLANDLNNQSSSTQNTPVPSTAPGFTSGGSPLSSDVLSLLLQSQGVTDSGASVATGMQPAKAGHQHEGGSGGGAGGGAADALASALDGSSSSASSSSSTQPTVVTEVNADGSITTVTTDPDGTVTTATAPASTQANASISSSSDDLADILEALQPIG